MKSGLNNNAASLQQLLKDNFAVKSALEIKRSGNITVSYNRVSSKDQMENGNSLLWQNEQIDLFAKKNDYEIIAKYGGTYESAKTDERKEFKKMLDDIKRNKSIANVIVYSYDRFSRSGANGIYLLENLRKIGVRIIAITQEVNSFSPTGMFQENLYMLLSKLDNDMRKDKSMAGTRSILQKGYWPYSIPLGYNNLHKHETADKHHYVINDKGILLKQAFKWKAEGKYCNKEILQKLEAKGLKTTLRHLAWIFNNVFYCGYIKSSLLPGELIIGKHPALISVDLFIRANNIIKQNPRSGLIRQNQPEALPLKVFVKDEISGSPFTGYINKRKNLYYYKTRDNGTKTNISAKYLNAKFADILGQFEFNKTYKPKLKEALVKRLEEKFKEHKENIQVNKKRISELQNQIDKLEERFVLNEITKEQFEKFSKKYLTEKNTLIQEIAGSADISSNLEKAVSKGLEMAENLSKMWCSGDFAEKQSLQYLLFPEGIHYNKKNDTVRTNRVNSIFNEIRLKSTEFEQKNNGNHLIDCHFGSHVGMTGFEPAAPSSRTKCATGLRYIP